MVKAHVVKDRPIATEELNEEQQQPPVEEGVIDVEGFPGRPHDTLVLRDFENHVALRVCNGDKRPKLKLSSYGRKMTKFGRLKALWLPIRAIEDLWLLSWNTSIRKQGRSIASICFMSMTLSNMLVELLEVSTAEARTETIQCHGSYVQLSWLQDVYQTKIIACHWICICCICFDEHSLLTRVLLDALRDLTQSRTYAWGTTTLVHKHDNLNEASKSRTRLFAGYISLLQCWIYKHFSSIGSTIDADDYDERRPHACRWTSGKALPVSTYGGRLDRLTLDVMGPLDSHSPTGEGCTMVWTITPYPIAPLASVKEMDDRWMQFSDYVAPVGKICVCSSDYMEWFYMISQPFMTPAQPEDPPRVLSIQQYDTFVELDVTQQPVVAATPDELDVDRPLNLRILTEGTEAYTVAEECLSIARSYIG
ncbi:Protein MAIN-LIKE 2 [Glycine soja]